MTSQTSYTTEQDHEVYDDILDKALAAFEGAATKFSIDVINDYNVRKSYMDNIKRMSSEVAREVDLKKISVKEASEFAYSMRNHIMEEHRKITSVRGLAFAEQHKKAGRTLDELLNKYSQSKFKKNFQLLSEKQKAEVYYATIEAAGRDSIKFTTKSRNLNILGKVGVLVTATLATYEILNAENKPKEAIKQGSQISGGVLGGFLAGLGVGSICGPGAPICAVAVILIGSTVGSIGASIAVDAFDEEIEEFTKWNIF